MRQALPREGPKVNKLHHNWRPTDDIRKTLEEKFPSLEFPYLEIDHTHGVRSSIHCYCKEHETFTRIDLSNSLYDQTQYGCSICANNAGMDARKADGYSTKQYIGKRGVQAGIFRAVKAVFPDTVWEHRMKCGREIDVYIPSIKMGVEYNGNYYHSTAIQKDIDYHLNKTMDGLAEKKDILHVFTEEAVEPYTGILNTLRLGARLMITPPPTKQKVKLIPKDVAISFHKEWNYLFPQIVELFCDTHLGYFSGKELVAVGSCLASKGKVVRISTKHAWVNPKLFIEKLSEMCQTRVGIISDFRNPITMQWLYYYLKQIDGASAKTLYPLNKSFEVDWEAVEAGIFPDGCAIIYDAGNTSFGI